jgi:hypothetical protein
LATPQAQRHLKNPAGIYGGVTKCKDRRKREHKKICGISDMLVVFKARNKIEAFMAEILLIQKMTTHPDPEVRKNVANCRGGGFCLDNVKDGPHEVYLLSDPNQTKTPHTFSDKRQSRESILAHCRLTPGNLTPEEVEEEAMKAVDILETNEGLAVVGGTTNGKDRAKAYAKFVWVLQKYHVLLKCGNNWNHHDLKLVEHRTLCILMQIGFVWGRLSNKSTGGDTIFTSKNLSAALPPTLDLTGNQKQVESP